MNALLNARVGGRLAAIIAGAIAIAARTLVPAWRAARTNPLTALRHD